VRRHCPHSDSAANSAPATWGFPRDLGKQLWQNPPLLTGAKHSEWMGMGVAGMIIDS